MKIQIPLQDFEIAFKSKITTNQNYPYSNYFSKHIQIEDKNHLFWKMELIDYKIQSTSAAFVGKYNEIIFRLKFIPNKNSNYRDFTIHYDAIMHEITNHQALIYINSDWENGIHDDCQQIGIIERDVPTNTIYPLHISLEKGSNWKGFKSMVSLGIKHISEGTDHLLFLLVLLLSAPLISINKKWIGSGNIKYALIRILKIATAFTIGHSITLFIGSFGLITPNTIWVEILIALSILITAIHAIKPIFPNKEIYIASGFGLIHGLAFATILANLNLETNKLILSLLGFNVGIELMQLFAIIMVMPWLLYLSPFRIYKWIRIIGASFAGIASVAWAIERYTERSNFISIHLQNTSNYAIWLILALAILAIFHKIIS
ncbi:HupE/UreJ family protein [Flavobacterium paronense]|uniref:HupE/UreJ family protein n=1 Tax=Flavobacterium paronense TaxID=1392775 RepID=A0ABV5GD12_9FLAO|nr:HupE/UreJ family protein [Flavobacterium paronense]MDN3676167.1 HupE/UreJ family protein [Flavobacterium paronense]